MITEEVIGLYYSDISATVASAILLFIVIDADAI